MNQNIYNKLKDEIDTLAQYGEELSALASINKGPPGVCMDICTLDSGTQHKIHIVIF